MEGRCVIPRGGPLRCKTRHNAREKGVGGLVDAKPLGRGHLHGPLIHDHDLTSRVLGQKSRRIDRQRRSDHKEQLGASGNPRRLVRVRMRIARIAIIRVASGQWAGTAWISRCGLPLLRWTLYQAALGAARTAHGRAWRAALGAKRPGDPHAFFKANVEFAAKLLWIIWGVWRSRRRL